MIQQLAIIIFTTICFGKGAIAYIERNNTP
jgi:hypothetical protein